MIPAAFMFIDSLPLTVNGKLDVKALPAVDSRSSAPMIAAPEEGTALERDIAGIWRDVLQIRNPGLDQNFFDVGGTSIHVADVHSRLQKLLDRRFSLTPPSELLPHISRLPRMPTARRRPIVCARGVSGRPCCHGATSDMIGSRIGL
jgi:hypothetical protein